MTITNILLILVVIAVAIYVVFYSIKKKRNAADLRRPSGRDRAGGA